MSTPGPRSDASAPTPSAAPCSTEHDHTASTPGHDHTASTAGHDHTASTAGHDHTASTPGHGHTEHDRVFPARQAEEFSARWDALKGSFVDEPRSAVERADTLVGDMLAELQTVFSQQRSGLEQSLHADDSSTEDLRVALRRYRGFFDRLLTL